MAAEMESPTSNENDTQAQPKPKPVIIYCCLKLEPVVYAFHLIHLYASVSFLAVCLFLINEDWLIDGKSKAPADALFAIILHFSVAVVVQLLLFLATLYAVKKRYWRCIEAYFRLMAILYAMVFLYIIIMFCTRDNSPGSDCDGLLTRLRRLPVICIMLLGQFFLRRCLCLVRNVDYYRKIFDYAIELNKASV